MANPIRWIFVSAWLQRLSRAACRGARRRRGQWVKCHDRIDAPWLLEGPTDGDSFKTYLEQVLVATLKPGDIVSATIRAKTADQRGRLPGHTGMRQRLHKQAGYGPT